MTIGFYCAGTVLVFLTAILSGTVTVSTSRPKSLGAHEARGDSPTDESDFREGTKQTGPIS